MIGRGAMSNPWIFLQIQQLRSGLPVYQPTPADKYELLRRYTEMCLEAMPERQAIGKLKQLIGHFAVALPGAAKLRADVHHAQSVAAAFAHLEVFFEPYLEHVST
jgi:tRNA-dihydrouridine synthase B